MSENSSKLILAGGILGLVFLIIFGLFLSDVELEYIEKEKPKIDEIELPSNVNQIINALESGKQLYPDWFQNDIAQVRTGQITSKEFLDTYYYLSNQGTIYAPITLWDQLIAAPEFEGRLDDFRVPTPEPIIYDDDYIIEKFVSGLNLPTAMTFVGEDILVLEKNTGKVIRILDNGVPYAEPVLDVPVEAANESGLLGITSISNHVFLYFSESESGFDIRKSHDQPIKNKVYRYDWDGETLTNPLLIKELPGNLDGKHRHNGGAMATNLNDEIYFVIGDLEQHGIFQNIISSDNIMETSSIFKVDTQNNNVELFAMGIRNSFGLAVDPVTGYLWDTENGHSSFDEINLVKSGFNSGWRLVMGPVDRYNPDIDIEPTLTQTIPPPFENFVYSDPEFSWYKPVAVTAIEFPDEDSFRKYSDWLFVGDFNNGAIYKFQLNADRTGFVFSNPELSDLVGYTGRSGATKFFEGTVFARDIQGGVTDIEFHNNAMYVTAIFDGSIYKIHLTESAKKIEEEKLEILKLLKTRSGIEFIDLSNSDFRGTNFDTAMISNVNFTRANLSHANLSGQDITGTILTEANLSNANLTGVDLSGVDLTGTRLTGVDLSGMDLTDTILMGADLSDTNLSNTILTNANLENAHLENANLLDVNLDSANLTNADLRNTILVDANLSNTILAGADLTNAAVTGIILTGADLENAVLTDTILNCVGHPVCVS